MSKNLKVVMTRTADVFIELRERAEISNKAGARIFMSIHLNAFNGVARGTETFKHTNSTASEEIAKEVNANLIRELGLPDRGVKSANFSVLRNTYKQSLSVLTEPRFIDNVQDAAIIKRPDFIYKTAKAHADAIKKYARDGDVICLDPGHGGHDSGATGYGLREKDLVLAIALKTRELLLDEPITISRTDARIFYNGEHVTGFIEDGTTYAQMRELAALTDVPVNWNQETKQAYLGGHPVDGVIIDGRTFLPVRELANNIGLNVSWNQQTKTVTLSD